MSIFRKGLAVTAFLAVLISAVCIYFTNNADRPVVEEALASNTVKVIPIHAMPVRDDTEFVRAAQDQRNEDEWWTYAAVQEWNKKVAENEAAARAAARVTATRHAPTRAPRAPNGGGDTGGRHYICPQYASGDNPSGDFAVPCYIIGRESHGSYTADNPHSSAYGAYQIMHLPPGTPPAEQDAIARGMALCNWNPPNYCAGG